MSPQRRVDALGTAIAEAIARCLTAWRKASSPSEGLQDAYALYVNRIEVSMQHAPAGRGWIQITVHDGRPGRSHSEYFRLDTTGSGEYRLTQ